MEGGGGYLEFLAHDNALRGYQLSRHALLFVRVKCFVISFLDLWRFLLFFSLEVVLARGFMGIIWNDKYGTEVYKKCLRILYPLLSHLQNGTKRLDGMQGTRFQFYVFGAILPVSNLKLNVSRPIHFPSDIAITEEICLSQRCTRSLHAPRFILFCLDFF